MNNEVTSLEREIEETRERLAHTIDELLHRAHPRTVVSREVTSIKQYFVDPTSGAPRTDHILKVAGTVVGAVALLLAVRRVAR